MNIAKIVSNKAQCRRCLDIVESTSVHQFVYCECGCIAVDGGHEYLRRAGISDDIIEMSIFDVGSAVREVLYNAKYWRDGEYWYCQILSGKVFTSRSRLKAQAYALRDAADQLESMDPLTTPVD